jgi:hypothetical protein
MSASSPNLESVLARIDGLEKQNEQLARQNRRLRWVVAGTVLLIGSLVLLARMPSGQVQAEPSPSRTLEADKLTLRDEQGNTRAGLTVGKDGPTLTFYDEQGKARAGLGLSRQGTALRFLNNDGRAMAGLSVERGGIAVGYLDEAGQVHAGSDAIKNVVGFALSDQPPRNLSPAERRP